MEREKLKVCPHCLAETGYYHQHWALWLYTSCHIHQCLLVDTCPQCQSGWRWDGLKNDWQCECGFNFRAAPIADLGSGTDSLSGLVIRRCGLAGDNAGSIERTSLLDAFDLSQLSLLMMSTALCLNNPGSSLHQLKLPSSNRELDALLSRCALAQPTGGNRVWLGAAKFGIFSPVVRSDVSIEVSAGWEAEESPGKVESDFSFSPEA